jgi:4-amino-4-deoxy-L-arabinose transferase-like glycosyltransferase
MPDTASTVSSWFRRHPETLHLAAAAGLILLWTCVVRLPFLHIVNDDEAFFSVMGTRWLHGELPYVDSFDVKPPLLFALFAAAQAIFGVSLATIKGLEIVFTAGGAWLLYLLVKRQGSESVARWCAFLFPVYSLTLTGVCEPNSLLQLPFIIAAFLTLLTAQEKAKPGRWLLLSGLMIGLAGLIKQTAIFEAIGLAGLIVWHFRRGPYMTSLLMFGVGAALPLIVFAGYFAAVGHLPEAFDAVVVQSLTRMNLDLHETKGQYFIGVTRFIPLIVPLLPLVGCSILALTRLKVIRTRFPSHLIMVCLVWFSASVAGVIALHSMFAYYAATLIPPLLIVAGVFVLHGIDFSDRTRKIWISLYIAGFTLGPLALDRGNLTVTDNQGPNDFAVTRAAAVQLKKLGVTPRDHMLVLKRGLYAYILTGTTPSARYYHNLHLVCAFPTPDASPLTQALAQRPRFILLAEPNYVWRCETRESHSEIAAALTAGYDLKATVHGQWDTMYIYQTRSPER